MKVRITDARMPPFCWQEKDILRLIHRCEKFKKAEIATAIAVYTVLTYYASNNGSDSFQMKRQTLCNFLGRSPNVVDGYLKRFAELGVLEKEPVVRDNEYRKMSFRLLPMPAVSLSTGEVSLPTGTPPAAHDDTPPSPQGQVSSPTGKRVRRKAPIEEPEFRNAGPGAPQDGDPADSEEPPLGERGSGADGGGGEQVADAGEDAGDLQPDGMFGSASGGSGLTFPGQYEEEMAESRRNGKPRKKRGPSNRPPDQWGPYEAVTYFQRRLKQKWGHEEFQADEAGPKEGGQLKGLLAKLEREGFGRGLMAKVIDHIFDHWDIGLRERLKWENALPSLSLICAPRWFETLVSEVRHGVPAKRGRGGVRSDEYDAEAAEKDRKSADGWGD